MQIKINNKEYEAHEGETVLDVCRREGIRIPTLCAHGKLKKEAACRLCLVEVNLTDKLVPSCVFPVCEKLEVTTESEKIKKAREINMELLWSDHAGKCVKCRRNRHCELQNMAEEYKIDNFHFLPRKEDLTREEELDLLRDNKTRVVVDDKNPAIHRTTEYCVECRRCINICPVKSYGFNNRSGDVVVGTPYSKELDCIFCGACVKYCPTAALTDKNNLEEVISKLDDIKTMAVAIVDPAVMESIGCEIPEIDTPEKLNGFLQSMGFERVFNLGWGMEKYFREAKKEAQEASAMVISSHCPAFSLYVKKYYPGLVGSMSKIKNPNELMAEYIKSEYARKEKVDPKGIVVISISACVSKKAILSQNQDHILTVRELGRLARQRKISPNDISESKTDGGFEFDEKALAMIESGGLQKLVSPSLRNKRSVVLNTMADMKKTLENIKKRKVKYDFVEGMICPGGCVHGGGQSIEVQSSKFKVQN